MAGKIRHLIDEIIDHARENHALIKVLKAKMILNGIDINQYSSMSEDDPAIISRLENLAKQIKICPDNR